MIIKREDVKKNEGKEAASGKMSLPEGIVLLIFCAFSFTGMVLMMVPFFSLPQSLLGI